MSEIISEQTQIISKEEENKENDNSEKEEKEIEEEHKENEDEEEEEEEDDNEISEKEEKKEIIKNIIDKKDNIDIKVENEGNKDKNEGENLIEVKKEIKEEEKEKENLENKEHDKIEDIKEIKEKDDKDIKIEVKEEIKEQVKEGIKNEDEKVDKEKDKIEEIDEDKKENREDLKEEKKEEEEIKIIKKKITLKNPETDLKEVVLKKEKKDEEKNENKQNKEKEIYLNPSDIRKEEIKEKEREEEAKLPLTNRTRYIFHSDKQSQNDKEKEKNNKINAKNNHQIYISVVPSYKKEAPKYNINQNQIKNIPEKIKIENRYIQNSSINKTPFKNITNNTQQQRIHQELIKSNKTDQKQNYLRKYEISKPATVMNTINNKPENNKISYMNQQKTQIQNQNLTQNKPQNKTIIVNRRTPSLPLTIAKIPKENKDIKIHNSYVPQRKYEITKPLKNTYSYNNNNIDKSKRIISNINPPINKKIVNFIVESKYSKKGTDEPSFERKYKITQNIYPGNDKFNTERKKSNTNSFFGYNSRTLDTRQKNSHKLKYYERCPNCGYLLNDHVDFD